ncbi:Zn-dependent hydrolase [Paenibacillus sp. JCM 10914]|uniref:Zn-dependent hydrolase n=1 Tax=Paenibacillus sp. JCM 10914 TaxID=1236974 RepID=UPI0003CCA9E1|nr:Zn-dependent hydrolase [Paenibacillus sp. JCM 10914]GAE06322.1 N-carbamoyl-L-amino acid hydrolase [Paenibacillus sp. JCM 10914]
MAGQSDNVKPNLQRLTSDIEVLSSFSDPSKPGWTRRPFTAWYESGRQWLTERMHEAGLEVSVDAAANLIGRLPGLNPALPSILIGSHTDTVQGGGRFDGIIGVVGGLEIARRLKESGVRLQHTLEIVDFTAEEPSEFGISTIGSRGMVGTLTEEMMHKQDPNGLCLRDAIDRIGGRSSDLMTEVRKPGEVALYLELHIEQGPVLVETGRTLGAVTGIVGIHRYRIRVTGQPNHAGTTPMSMRQDALTGFGEICLALERICRSYGDRLVGTIGRVFNEPNASNVIPSDVTFEMEIRSLDPLLSEQVHTSFVTEAYEIAARRQLALKEELLSRSEPVHVNANVLELIEHNCALVAPVMKLPSGAGHDANQLARIAPIGMIFVPSRGGRSHCPEEWTDYEQVAAGVEALALSLLQYDQIYGDVKIHVSE